MGVYLGALPGTATGAEKPVDERTEFLRKFNRQFWKGYSWFGPPYSFFTSDFKSFVRKAAKAAAFGRPELNPNDDLLLIHFAYGIRVRYACPRSLTKSQARKYANRIANLPVNRILRQLDEKPFSFFQFSKPELELPTIRPGKQNKVGKRVRFRAYDALDGKTLFVGDIEIVTEKGERKLDFSGFRSFFNTNWPVYRRFLVKRRDENYAKKSVEGGKLDKQILFNSITNAFIFEVRHLDKFAIFKTCRYLLPPDNAKKMSDLERAVYSLRRAARRMIVPVVVWR